jgi:hypothetical protein
MVFNTTFKNISVISCSSVLLAFYWRRKLEYPEKTTDMPQVTDKLHHIIGCREYTSCTHLSRIRPHNLSVDHILSFLSFCLSVYTNCSHLNIMFVRPSTKFPYFVLFHQIIWPPWEILIFDWQRLLKSKWFFRWYKLLKYWIYSKQLLIHSEIYRI